ncbi:nuclear transport factor 2 family protein [Dyadobacter sp. 32]|uniref:YybH family protein n=1 Tax=Dyadobacter sp. 32 TaxID=538966 RepID=UPI0011ECFC96
MRNYVFALGLFFTAVVVMGQPKSDKDQIYGIMNRQAADWNGGNISSFMNGYWESDSLMFVGKSGVTYGYKATYENYLKRYPDRAAMGTLKFDFINLSFPEPHVAFLVGKFYLTRPEKGDLSGFYTLLWRKINGKWVIVCDHTS